jgi:hypothetical protein
MDSILSKGISNLGNLDQYVLNGYAFYSILYVWFIVLRKKIKRFQKIKYNASICQGIVATSIIIGIRILFYMF